MSLTTHDPRTARSREPARRRPGAVRAAIRLTWVLTGLVAGASLAGLLVDGVYAGSQ
jgi:hypothetical protein